MDKTKEYKKVLEKQQYRFAGNSVVKVCNWCKQALRGWGECYKHKFYGIPSWRCVQMSPWIACDNSCVHCWRPIEFDMSKLIDKKRIDKPVEIIDKCIEAQNKLLTGFGGHLKVNKKRYLESKTPSHFAISLIGEPTLYPKIGELVQELRKRGMTSFIVSNGLHPEIIEKLEKKSQLPTQLYVSLNSSNKEDYKVWHNSEIKKAWEKYNETLELLNKLRKKGKRTVLRMTLVKNKNMSDKNVREFSELIKKSGVLFVEVKSYMAIGYSRKRLGYEMMPQMKEIRELSKKLAKATNYKILDEHIASRIVLLGKAGSKSRMKIKKEEI